MSRESDLGYLGIAEAGALFRRRELSPVELADALIARGERLQESIVSYVTMTPELARSEAKRAEAAFMRGDAVSPLAGIPVGYKDNIMTRGIRTTAGSALRIDWKPDID